MAMSKLARDQLEFVDSLTDEFNCPICLGTLQEPYLTACCGNHFCEACTNKVKEGANKCPLCQETPLNGIINKGLRRKLNELKVYCVHKETGCKWIGDLGKLEQHLATGDNDGECQFVLVKCTVSDFCKVKVQRKLLRDHTDNDCQFRQFKCEHCDYQSTYLVITTEHYNQCLDYPVPCPNKCSEQLCPRGQLDVHLTSCPEQELDCTFSEMGCKKKLKRRQLQQHLADNLLQHQLIMCQAYHLQKQTIASLQEDKKKLEQQVASLAKDADKLQILALPVDQIKEINWPLYLFKMSQNNSIPIMPIILEIPLKIGTINCKAEEDFHYHAPTYYSLYSHPNGYKLKLSAQLVCLDSIYMACYLCAYLDTSESLIDKVNGMIYALSIDLYAMAGEYDADLEWPFENKISVTLLNKQSNEQHYEIQKYFRGTKASQLTVKDDTKIKQTDDSKLKKEYEQLLENGDPMKVHFELCNMYNNALGYQKSLLFFLDDDLLRQNKESNAYIQVVFHVD